MPSTAASAESRTSRAGPDPSSTGRVGPSQNVSARNLPGPRGRAGPSALLRQGLRPRQPRRLLPRLGADGVGRRRTAGQARHQGALSGRDGEGLGRTRPWTRGADSPEGPVDLRRTWLAEAGRDEVLVCGRYRPTPQVIGPERDRANRMIITKALAQRTALAEPPLPTHAGHRRALMACSEADVRRCEQAAGRQHGVELHTSPNRVRTPLRRWRGHVPNRPAAQC